MVDVRLERVDAITADDVVREGFPGWTPRQFVELFFRANRCTPDTEITRIEFKYIDEQGDA